MNVINKIAQLARDSGIEEIKDWPKRRLEDWLGWCAASGALITCYQGPGSKEPLGFAVVRPINSLTKKHQHYRMDERGQTLFVDMAVAKTSDILRALGFGVLQRYGERKYIASEKKGKMHIHSWHKIRKSLLRKH